MAQIIKQNRMALYFPSNGIGTAMTPLGLGRVGGDDATNPNAGKGVVYGNDKNGFPVPIVTFLEAPGGLPTKTVNFYEEATVNALIKARDNREQVYLQERWSPSIALDNPFGWKKIWHYGRGQPGDETIGAGAVREYAGAGVVSSLPVVYDYVIEYLFPALFGQSPPATPVAADITDIALITDILPEAPGYRPGRIGYASYTAEAGLSEVVFNATGGGSWEPVSGVAGLAVTVDIAALAYHFINEDTIRLIGVAGTDAASNAQLVHADIIISDPGTAVWTIVVEANGSVADAGSAIGWKWLEELLVCSEGDIYILGNRGDVWDQPAVFTGAAVINGMAFTPDSPDISEAVYFFGATGLLLRKNRGSLQVSILIPPNANNISAVSVANEGTLFAGIGSELFMSVDGGKTAGGWTLLRDFGTNYTITEIGLLKGDPIFLRVVVNDVDGTTGQVWLAPDRKTWQQVDVVANSGYSAAAFNPLDLNDATIGGLVHSGNLLLQKLSPAE